MDSVRKFFKLHVEPITKCWSTFHNVESSSAYDLMFLFFPLSQSRPMYLCDTLMAQLFIWAYRVFFFLLLSWDTWMLADKQQYALHNWNINHEQKKENEVENKMLKLFSWPAEFFSCSSISYTVHETYFHFFPYSPLFHFFRAYSFLFPRRLLFSTTKTWCHHDSNSLSLPLSLPRCLCLWILLFQIENRKLIVFFCTSSDTIIVFCSGVALWKEKKGPHWWLFWFKIKWNKSITKNAVVTCDYYENLCGLMVPLFKRIKYWKS